MYECACIRIKGVVLSVIYCILYLYELVIISHGFFFFFFFFFLEKFNRHALMLAFVKGTSLSIDHATDFHHAEKCKYMPMITNRSTAQENRSSGLSTRSDTNRSVQSQNRTRRLQFRI